MIIQEYPYRGNEGLVRHFSDCEVMIKQNETGIIYSEAVDVYPCRYTYSETEEKLPVLEVPHGVQLIE